MQKDNNKNGSNLKIIFMIITLIIIVWLVRYGWSKYITVVGGESTGDIAKWVFKVNGNDTQTTDIIDFAITRTDKDNEHVKDEMLAPGTEGIFEVEIDASETETLIEYVIDVNLIKKPENLRFFLKDNTTSEKIYITEKDNHIITKGFMSLNDSKVRNEKIYWEWPLETGRDADEIRKNDELDTKWIGEKMEMQISVSGLQVLGPGDVEIPKGTMAKYDFSDISWNNINTSTISGVNQNSIPAATHNVTYGENYLEFNGTNSWVNLGEMNNFTGQTIEGTFSVDEVPTKEVSIIGNWQIGGGGIQITPEGYIRRKFFYCR